MSESNGDIRVDLPETLLALVDAVAGGEHRRAEWLQAAVEQALAADATVRPVFLPASLLDECERIVGQGPRLESWVRELIEAEVHRIGQPGVPSPSDHERPTHL